MRRFEKRCVAGDVLGSLVALIVLAPSSAAAEPAAESDGDPIELHTLGNGLEVVLQPDRSTDRVALCLAYRVGNRDRPGGLSGLAHLTEHLMFEGSRNVGEDEFDAILVRAGATDVTAFTDPDRTTYLEVLPSRHLPTALWLESDRMASMLEHLDEEVLSTQREVVIREFRQRFQDSPMARAQEIAYRILFPEGHPYADPVTHPLDYNRVGLEDIRWFFQRWYGPNNARLALVGGFDPREAMALVERYFGSIRSSYPRPPERPASAAASLRGEHRIVIAAPVARPVVIVYWPTPAFLAPGDAELDFVARVLGRGRRSQLHRRLVTTGLARSVYARQYSFELASYFALNVEMATGQRHEETLAVIDEELERLRVAPIETAELEAVRMQLSMAERRRFDSLGDRAISLASYRLAPGEGGALDLRASLARYGAVSAESLRRAVVTLVPRRERLVVFIAPDPRAPAAGLVVRREVRP